MAHTISYGMFKLVSMNGRPVGEPDFFAGRAGELGVPIGMVSGDQVVADQVTAICPWAETVVVKQALSNQAANCIPPARARDMIRAGAKRAVERAANGELQPLPNVGGPYEFEVQMRNPISEAMAKNLDSLQEFEMSDDNIVRMTAENMDLGFRRVAYFGYADRPGTTKY